MLPFKRRGCLLLLLLCCYLDCVTSFTATTNVAAWSTSTTRATLRHVPTLGNNNSQRWSNTALVVEPSDHDSNDSKDTQRNTIAARKVQLSREFLTIAAPALLQLAAEPLASLVDTLYLGRLGAHVLGGAGVAVAAQYSVSKLYNDPLLRTSISLVAAQDGRNDSEDTGSDESEDTDSDDKDTIFQNKNEKQQNALSVAVSSALVLALVVGTCQGLLFTSFSQNIVQLMGVSPTSDMWPSATSYLHIRALGTPAATLWLVTNGIFRGLGDTKTPLLYSLAFTSLNAILDPVFIFGLHWGAAGAAAGTAIAQYAALLPLLLALHKKVPIQIAGQWKQLKLSLKQYTRAGGLVLMRTVAKVLCYSLCARQAALLGSVAAAAYNLTFTLGFATTQMCEAVAVAVQTLLAREMAQTNTKPFVKAKLISHLIATSLWLGGGVATLLSLVTYWRRDAILAGMTTNVAIRQACKDIFPIVLVTQVLKGLAYPVNGIIMGGLDWVFSMLVMWMSNLVCLAMLWRNWNGVTLGQLWGALAMFMGTQVVAGILRYSSKTGVWKVLRGEDSHNQSDQERPLQPVES